MKHLVKYKSNLGRKGSHRKAMLRTMVTQLLKHECIETTVAKAKRVKPVADWMITLGKKGSLSHRRRAAAYVRGEEGVSRVFGDLARRYQDRPGGYTAVVRTGKRRKGDDAETALLMLVDSEAHMLYKALREEQRVVRSRVEIGSSSSSSSSSASSEATRGTMIEGELVSSKT